MGRKCVVEGCTSESTSAKDKGVSFHKFPANATVRAKWIALCQLPQSKQSCKGFTVCSRHFLLVDFASVKGNKFKLRTGVLPSVFPWDKSKLEAMKSGSKSASEASVEPTVDEPDTSAINVEQSTSRIKVEPGASRIKVEPGTSRIKVEPGTSRIKVEPGFTIIKVEPGTSIVKNEPNPDPEFSLVKIRPRVRAIKRELNVSPVNIETRGRTTRIEPRRRPIKVESNASPTRIEPPRERAIKIEPSASPPVNVEPQPSVKRVIWKRPKPDCMMPALVKFDSEEPLAPDPELDDVPDSKYFVKEYVTYEPASDDVDPEMVAIKLEGIKMEGIKEEENEDKTDRISTPEPGAEVEVMTEGHKEYDEALLNAFELKGVDSKPTVSACSIVDIDIAVNAKLEASDYNNVWYPARIAEIDHGGNELLIHFEKYSHNYDEWINMDSPRLRPYPSSTKRLPDKYGMGEHCLASWIDTRKFPATVTKVLQNDTYEVLFDDGHRKSVRAARMRKIPGDQPQVKSSLFEPVEGTKQDRRDKKRKINVKALFGKRARVDIRMAPRGGRVKPSTSTSKAVETPEHVVAGCSNIQVIAVAPPPPDDTEPVNMTWSVQWKDGIPVGTPATLDCIDGPRDSIIVPDPRIPEGWQKHFVQRRMGNAIGKWDCVMVSPTQRKFRSKNDVRNYYKKTLRQQFDEWKFDFRSNYRQRKTALTEYKPPTIPVLQPEVGVEDEMTLEIKKELIEDEAPPVLEVTRPLLKIQFIDNSYKCPIDGCHKSFRRENLAQMHVKHYHPKYSQFLDSSPNVADLAYARTVGDKVERSQKVINPAAFRHLSKIESKLHMPILTKKEIKVEPAETDNTKDAEIIKLLSARPFDKNEAEPILPLPSGLPSNMYPDFKLKDLLNRTEGVPKHEDLNIERLCSTRPPMGIKTLLPVRTQEEPVVKLEEDPNQHPIANESRPLSESSEPFKGGIDSSSCQSLESPLSPEPTLPAPAPQPDTIIEGGEVIKIVRMKQEEIINCTCGYTEEDGLMIQCELCMCWQHAYCNGIQRESEVPEKYVCYICQHPLRERQSKKYYHDQDWLKQGTLPTCRRNVNYSDYNAAAAHLKAVNDISGGLLEVQDYLRNLNLKIKIAEDKEHPKLYLWSKPWPKTGLPEKRTAEDVKMEKEAKQEIKTEKKAKEETKTANVKVEIKEETKADEDDDDVEKCYSLLKAELDKEHKPIAKPAVIDNGTASAIPKPEAAIEPSDCRDNLLQHIREGGDMVEERLKHFTMMLDQLEAMDEDGADDSKTRQTLEMISRNLDTMREFTQIAGSDSNPT